MKMYSTWSATDKTRTAVVLQATIAMIKKYKLDKKYHLTAEQFRLCGGNPSHGTDTCGYSLLRQLTYALRVHLRDLTEGRKPTKGELNSACRLLTEYEEKHEPGVFDDDTNVDHLDGQIDGPIWGDDENETDDDTDDNDSIRDDFVNENDTKSDGSDTDSEYEPEDDDDSADEESKASDEESA